MPRLLRKFFSLLLVVMLFTTIVNAQENPDGFDYPEMVSLPGSLGMALGCDEDWQPSCEVTQLTEVGDGLFEGTFTVPAGDWEYKVALNGGWDQNYGANAEAGGPNLTLSLAEETEVTFTYNHYTGEVTDSVNAAMGDDMMQEQAQEPSEPRPTENPDGFDYPEMVSLPGSLGMALGCDEDWQPSCEVTQLTEVGDGLFEGTFTVPAGEYEYKVALNGTWDQNYGLDGVAGGPNIPLTVPQEMEVTFRYDHYTGMVTDSLRDETFVATVVEEEVYEVPDMVNVPGTLQPAIGCAGEWAPGCEESALEYMAQWDIFMRSFELPAGSYEYKVAIDGGWGENYGATADANGANIPLTVPEDMEVTFFYDHKTNWIADDIRHDIVTAPGNYQTLVGCESDWEPACMITWLQDVDGDGIYNYSVALPAGEYETKAAIGRTWDVNYGEGGVAGGPNIAFTVSEDGTTVNFTYDSNLNIMLVTAGTASVTGANLQAQRAYWVTEDTLAWSVTPDEGQSAKLIYSLDGSLRSSLFGLDGNFETVELTVNDMGLSQDVLDKFPHLAGLTAYTISEDMLDVVPDALKSKNAIGLYDSNDNLLDVTGLQIPGVLDDLYTYDGPLGVTFDGDVPTITVWAPTAQDVRFHLFDDGSARTEGTIYDMEYDAETGAWRITGEPDWYGKYYLFEVTVYAPSVGELVTNVVTDPYSFSLSTNSLRSQIIDLNDPEYMPEGWMMLEKPELNAFEDITIYEIHVRDFSVWDESVPDEMRGTYLAFTLDDSNGVQHLRGLQEAGLSHLHLLPTFDIATINENRSRWFDPDYEAMALMAPDSEEQQAAIFPIRDLDGFNWGYDPFHFFAVEGSYAVDPEGASRVLEYRQMVQSLNEMGLRVVQDVVYNHTNAAGQANKSVLDKVVPGYYHRLNSRGNVFTSTCCQNTATEHNMMRRLMVDSVVVAAVQYKIDGFRFDLMGHHMVEDMVAVREALDALTVEEHGIDGSKIYVYGEGWNFGEVADNARGVNATQLNLPGTGIGTFNDRLRDVVRGGSPVDGARYQQQGLGNGLYTIPAEAHETNDDVNTWLDFADLARVGLAGNLADYSFTNRNGEVVTGAQLNYGGVPPQPAGYAQDPQENVVYVSKHDNQTLYDQIVTKAPTDTPLEDRVRMQNLNLSFVMYAQGVPFFHAGSDMLRSKSLDNDSYNSGDWFNRLDWTYQTNNFGVGLPPEGSGGNGGNWDIMRPLLANPNNVPTTDHIMANVNAFRDMLNVRYSTPLFRLETGQAVQERVSFHNTGENQVPGLIVMSIDDMSDGLDDLDPAHDMVVVVFNTTGDEMSFTPEADLSGLAFELHPTLANGSDAVLQSASFDSETGTFTVPRLSAAVFVLPQS